MAKYDQTLLKFLNQNSDRAPTLIDMMTKLKIGISDLTDSLADLLAQGAIVKNTNDQGMETWSVASKTPTPQPMATPIATETIAKPVAAVDVPVATIETPAAKIEVEPPPVELPKVESPAAAPVSPISPIPASVEAVASPSAQVSPMPFYPAPAPKGVGLFTFIIGLVLTAALSVWLGSRLTHREIDKVSLEFVNQKMFTDIGNAFLAFEDKTKVETASLKDQVKSLEAQVAALQAVSDSLKVALAAQAEKATAKGKKAKTARRR